MPQLSLRPFWQTPDGDARLYHGHVVDVLRRMPAGSVQCCCTSPPYFQLRDYGTGNMNEIGQEQTPEAYTNALVMVFREVRRVLRDDGVLWLNLGDSYANSCATRRTKDGRHHMGDSAPSPAERLRRLPTGLRNGDLIGIPWRVAFALQDDGWVLRSDIPWVKRSSMPESVQNRPAKALEYIFMLTKERGCFFDMEAVRKAGPDPERRRERTKADGVSYEDAKRARDGTNVNQCQITGTRNFRNADLWFESVDGPHGLTEYGDELVGLDITSRGYAGAHFATYPEWLITPLIKAGTSERGACAKCGAPWERVVENVGVDDFGSLPKRADCPGSETSATSCFRTGQVNRKGTAGWQPTCECHGRFVKQRVRVLRPVSLEKNVGDHEKKAQTQGDLTRSTLRAPRIAVGDRDRSLPSNRNGITGSLDGVPRDMEEAEEDRWVYEPALPLEEHPVRPCIVLDPFVGSGTTVATALKLGRWGWGIDLSETYLREHACRRVGAAWLAKQGPGAMAAPAAQAVSL